MNVQSLNGTWLYRVGCGAERPIKVPFSAHPVGHSECRRTFDLEHDAARIFLQLDGITYAASVTLNGVHLGDLLPYCEYRYDVTALVRPQGNELLVALEDIAPAFGPTEGWENFGGIIRGVKLLYAREAVIEDVFFHAALRNDYRDADCTVEVKVNAPAGAQQEVTLLDGESVVLSYTENAGNTATHALSGIRLWSPDDPHLYSLRVRLLLDGVEKDAYECKVGLREVACERHRFLLNGKPLFFRGICRHEMVGSSGHTVTYEQIESDLVRIKEMGCNFVRLVHYPHDKRTLEIADRIGLMVSEEPGLWWSDTSNPEIAQGSLEVLRRTILRDRNHACIAFWLCFNECVFTEQFLIDSARVCRENDPTRLVSGANCMSNEDTLKYYNLCGFDFYTMHPYAETFARASESARVLHDKPLLFSEWGGYHVFDNPRLLGDFIANMKQLYRQNSDEGALAGAFFWSWADCKDYNRGAPACIDGTLREGLVTADREPNMIFDAFVKAWNEPPTAPEETLYRRELLADAPPASAAFHCEEAGADLVAALRTAEGIVRNKFGTMRPRRLPVGPIFQDGAALGLLSTPKVLPEAGLLSFIGSAVTDRITLIGCVGVNKGYPITGAFGEEAAEVVIYGDAGVLMRYTLRNGREITTAFTTLSSSRIDPQADLSVPFAHLYYETNFEQYRIRSLTIELPAKVRVAKVELRSLSKGYDLLTYGVFSA